MVTESSVDNATEFGAGEGIEHINMTAGEQGANDLETWVLGGGTNKDNLACFDVREQCILLGFVKPMDLIEKNDGAAIWRGGVDNGGDIRLFGGDGREMMEIRVYLPSDNPRECRVDATRRSPKDNRVESILAHAKP